MTIYLELTKEFNEGRLRAVICSGQAVVLHRLAIMSKDGDWILREDKEALQQVLRVLDRHGARYRFGAPLDVRWMAGGWSSHFEFRHESLRVRTDFFTRPPRVDERRVPILLFVPHPIALFHADARRPREEIGAHAQALVSELEV